MNNLPAGNYDVTISDANNCVTTASVSVTEPLQLTLALTSTPALCNGDSTGAATVLANGGTSGYTYSWFPGGATNATAAQIPAGNYSVLVTDANGCTAVDSILVSQPVAIALSTTTVPALCGASNGSAGVNANGGSPPFTYSWSPSGGTSANASNLSGGAYVVTVTDANGCFSSAIANVLNTGGPSVNASLLDPVSCHGGSDGSADVTVTTGTAPFTYAWSPSGGTGAVANGLPAGNYSVTVTDANGCISSDNITVTEPAPVQVQVTGSPALCNGSSDGSASANAAGGTAPYAYAWTSGSGASLAIGLAAGNYSVTVTDANGCTVAATVSIMQPPSLVLTMTSSPAHCNATPSGSASVTVTGGTGGYSYLWLPDSAVTQTSGNLLAGNYSVMVTDVNGCTSTNSVTVTQPAPVTLGMTSTPSTCGASNGSATVSAGGGNPPYSYLWSPSGGTASTAPNLPAGTFTVEVTDANGCPASNSVNVSNAGGPAATAQVLSHVSCYGLSDGTASVSVSSGHPPYTYIWSPTGGSGTQATGLTAGNYSVVVADINGCITLANVTVTQPPEITLTASATPATCGDANGSVSSTATGGTGAFAYTWTPAGGNASSAAGLPAGVYTVLVTDANGCTNTASTTILNSGGATVTLQSLNPVTCNGGADGNASVSVMGGAPPFTYNWFPSGITTAAAAGLTAAAYSVLVTDSVGCITQLSVTITEPPPIVIQTSITPAGCNGATDGSAMAQAAGGTGALTYFWNSGGGTDSILSAVAAGNYVVYVTDQNGCTDSASVTVTSPSSVTLSVSSTDISCYGSNDGTASVTTTGGTAPFTYSWYPAGGNAPLAENLAPGNYSVTVTDSNGCVSVVTAGVIEPPLLQLEVSDNITLCVGENTTLFAFASGGTAPYSFLWSTGAASDSLVINPTSTLTYSVEVEDANGCTAAPLPVTVTLNPPLNLSAASTPEICEGDAASIAAVAGGGNGGPYSYSWNSGAITTDTATVYPQADSTFTVIVSDGCSPDVQTTVQIGVNPRPEVNFIPQLLEGCMPVDASFTNFGTAPSGSVYSWDLGDGTLLQEANVSHTYAAPGQYTVSLVVTSPEGCTDELTVVNAVTVHDLPVADFGMSSQELSILTPSVDFTDLSSGVANWSWDFGDNTYSGDVNPVHDYAEVGSYTIQLIVENEAGCLDTTYNTVRIVEDFTVFIPNAFTPNGDQANNHFIAQGIGWKSYEMFILDRWGLEIFHSTSRDNPWNGTFYNGSRRCQSDVYEYIILVRDNRDNLHKFIGHVSLVQ